MQVTEFLKTIQAQPELPLLFEFSPGHVVQGGYHVTEIKNASYETIDCGNSLHSWNEVIVQVWVPAEAKPEDDWMPSGKFMKIWNVVDSRLALVRDAEVRIEYGDATHLTSNYQVDGIVVTEDGLVVQMAPPRTMCKPREILIPLNSMVANVVENVIENGSCCSPAESVEANGRRKETVSPLPIRVGAAAVGSACCSPKVETKSGCC